jgi:hypothetical protein
MIGGNKNAEQQYYCEGDDGKQDKTGAHLFV